MKTETKITFALVNSDNKMVLDFGTSEKMMSDYLHQQFEIHGSFPRGTPMKITTVSTFEEVQL